MVRTRVLRIWKNVDSNCTLAAESFLVSTGHQKDLRRKGLSYSVTAGRHIRRQTTSWWLQVYLQAKVLPLWLSTALVTVTGRQKTSAQSPEKFEQAWTKDGGHDGMLEDWDAALNFIEVEKGARPTGWWGLSMGTMMGLPVTAADDRIKAALLGLMGSWGPNGEELMALAPKVSCPVRFLVQWDDEIVPRDACLELFTAIGTSEKTLHGNPGIHTAIPPSEFIDSVNFLDEMLG